MKNEVLSFLSKKNDEAIAAGNKFQGFLGCDVRDFNYEQLGMMLNVLHDKLTRTETLLYKGMDSDLRPRIPAAIKEPLVLIPMEEFVSLKSTRHEQQSKQLIVGKEYIITDNNLPGTYICTEQANGVYFMKNGAGCTFKIELKK